MARNVIAENCVFQFCDSQSNERQIKMLKLHIKNENGSLCVSEQKCATAIESFSHMTVRLRLTRGRVRSMPTNVVVSCKPSVFVSHHICMFSSYSSHCS